MYSKYSQDFVTIVEKLFQKLNNERNEKFLLVLPTRIRVEKILVDGYWRLLNFLKVSRKAPFYFWLAEKPGDKSPLWRYQKKNQKKIIE